jgi:hypothetical protein
MFKIIQNALCVLTISLSFSSLPSQVAEAKAVNYLYNCNISFKAKGRSVRIIGGYTRAKGTGVLSCLSYTDGSVVDVPLKISVKGVGLGLGVSGFNINGAAVGLGINKNPESLLGTYAKISADVAVGLGVRTGVAGRLNFRKGSAVLGVEFSGQSGLGVGVDLLEVKISRDQSKLVQVSQKEHHNTDELHGSLKRIESKPYRESSRGSRYNHREHVSESDWDVYDDSESKWHKKKKSSNVKLVKVERGDVVKIVDKRGRLVRKLKID